MKIIYLLTTLVLTGCSFVQLSKAGAGVAQLDPQDVTNCKQVGVVTSRTRDRIVMKRSADSVREELTVLARNEAAMLGGNAIVPIGIPEQGSQRFNAYLCN